MAVQMHRVNIVAGVAEFKAIAATFLYFIHWLHGSHGEGLAVDGPLIEATQRRIVFDNGHLDGLVGNHRRAGLAEAGIIPFERPWFPPARFAFFAVISDDDAHAVTAVVIVKIAHHPYAG